MIQITNLAFSYRRSGRRPGRQPGLFSGLDLDLPAGGIFGLLGRNGAGKTSLLRLISGQLYRHDGDCSVFGLDPGKRSPELLSEIFFLPEEFHVPAIAGEAYVSLYAPFYPKFDEARFRELLTEFELDGTQRLTSMSYGQKKKFLLAFTLASNCRLLLLDEPTNGLDIPSKRQFRRAVAASISEEQSILISTHQVRDMENLIDPIIVLDSGQIVFFHGLDDVSQNLAVSVDTEPPQGDDVVYAEKGLGGYTVIRHKTNAGSSIDLELLFNAVVDPESRLADVLSAKGEDSE